MPNSKAATPATSELPKLDVTDNECMLVETEWMDIPQNLAQAELFSAIGHRICRERQLLEAQARISSLEAEKERLREALRRNNEVVHCSHDGLWKECVWPLCKEARDLIAAPPEGGR